MKRITKYKSHLILFIFLVLTFLNKYVIPESEIKWHIVDFAFTFSLFIYALADAINTKRGLSLSIMFIFGMETIAVLMGWNLQTDYYTEFVLLIGGAGIYYTTKSIKNGTNHRI